MLLEGKVAIVSGIGPGMGRDITLALAREGADIAMGARREKGLVKVAGEVEALGRKVAWVPTDITVADDCARLAQTARDELGRVDILVNNAFSDGTFTLFEEGGFDGWRATMDVNLIGTLQMTYAALPHLREQDDSRVIMVNSQAAQIVQERFGAYAASKGALAVATQGLARELGRYGVRVNGIHPSYIWGKSVEWYVNDMAEKRGVDFQVVYDELADGTCLKYLPSSAEIAGAVVFFASPLAKAVTGQSLNVNCGEHLCVTAGSAGGLDLSGRVVLITGGASGIGRASAQLFVARGASVMIADLDADRAATTAAELGVGAPDGGGSVDSVVTDVALADQVEAMVARTVDRFGGLDAAVNNAGTPGTYQPLADQRLSDWQRTVDINLTGTFLCLQAELAVMGPAGRGAIVNVASAAGLMGFANLPAYVASKHGVVGLTKSVALEFARGGGIRVNAVCPGNVHTPMLEGFTGGDPKALQGMGKVTPIGRLAEPAEIAEAIVWLCSDAASFVTGHAMAVDGGVLAT